jgi:hypothetical protein
VCFIGVLETWCHMEMLGYSKHTNWCFNPYFWMLWVYNGTILYCFISAVISAIFNVEHMSFVLANAPGKFNFS